MTRDFPLPANAPGVSRRTLTAWLWPLSLVLAMVLAATPARAASITFTNFPSIVSNTYNGVITLQINGLTNGQNVVVQKFLDVNTNGIIDVHDLLVQQFQLTAGQANTFLNGSTTVTVTNFMPGDMSKTPGEIIAPLNFQNGDFMQSLAGQYLYKVSSPSGQFSPATNLLVVTNAFFSSVVTGAVVNVDTFSNVPGAIVLLFPAANSSFVQAGAVANQSGFFTVGAPPGTYFLGAAASNYVADLDSQSVFPIVANFTNSVTVQLTPSATNITGRVVNASTNSIVIPGLTGLASSTNNFLSLYFTDTNGNFTVPVTSNSWAVTVDDFAAQFEGYLTFQTNQFINVSNKLVHLTNSLSKATAIFYGTLTNNSGQAMPGVYMIATDNANHQSLGMTDKNGRYVLGVIGGTNEWQVGIVFPNNPGLTNTYVFGPGVLNTNINAGQAIEQNFIAALAPFTISGTVQDIDGHPISNVVVFATATNNSVVYQAFDATTDANGDYSLNVFSPGDWTVGLNTNSLAALGFSQFPPDQTTNIDDANAVINFSVLVCGEIEVLTTNLPNAQLDSPYDAQLEATSCQNITNWLTAYGITLTSLYDHTNVTYPPGTPIYSTAGLQGYLLTDFSYGLGHNGGGYFGYESNCTATETFGNETATFSDISATVNVSGPIASNTVVTLKGRTWTTKAAPSQVAAGEYQTTFFRAGPDSYTIGDNPLSYAVTNGMFMTGSGSPKTNLVASLTAFFHSLTPGESLNVASSNAYTGTNDAIVWIKNGTNVMHWGQYLISAYGPQTTNLPPGLYFTNNEVDTIELAGTPSSLGTNNGLFNFTVEAVDTDTNAAVQTLSLQVDSNTNVSPTLQTLGQFNSTNGFQMQVNNVQAGLNYTLLMSTNLDSTNWVQIFTTNAPNSNPLIIPDVNATNPARFYRIQVSQ